MELLRRLARIEGIYVPRFYDVTYKEDGTLASFTPNDDAAKPVITKRIVRDIDSIYYPKEVVVPFAEAVHDRVMMEVFRGCIRGCRFCQAGTIYRPVREKSPKVIDQCCRALVDSTGYDEISLTSLSTSDYTGLMEAADTLLTWCDPKKVSLSLPSLRVDNFSVELMDRVQHVRKGGLTFAPEAGTQRMRDIINKQVTREELQRTCRIAFEGGWLNIKLYFMIGLPFETMEDVAGIAELAQMVVGHLLQRGKPPQGKEPKSDHQRGHLYPKSPLRPFSGRRRTRRSRLTQKLPCSSPASARAKSISIITTERPAILRPSWPEETAVWGPLFCAPSSLAQNSTAGRPISISTPGWRPLPRPAWIPISSPRGQSPLTSFCPGISLTAASARPISSRRPKKPAAPRQRQTAVSSVPAAAPTG